jgi:hypothetical protein
VADPHVPLEAHDDGAVDGDHHGNLGVHYSQIRLINYDWYVFE